MKKDRMIRFITLYPESAFKGYVSEFRLNDCTFRELMEAFNKYNAAHGNYFKIKSHS